MRAVLLFPPATDPRAPHLALPALTAALRQAGIEVHQIDLDIEGLRALLRPDRLTASIERLRSQSSSDVAPERRAALGRLSEGLVDRVSQALRIVHDPVRFYDGNDLAAARATIDTAVAVASAAAPLPVTYSLEPIRYDVDGWDTRRLPDLLRVTGLPEANLFHDFWETNALPRIDALDPDLVGVSLANRQQLIPGLTLARRLKERGHFVVLGGTLLAKFAERLTDWPEFFRAFADGVVVYEGETALVEIMGQIQGGHDFARVPNYRFLEGAVVKSTTAHVENVDTFPTPDFAGLPLDDYLVPRPVLPVFFGKGCYHSGCRFCDIPHINRLSRQRYRRRSPDRVVADLRRLEERFGARHFVATDESLSPEVLSDLAEAFSGAPPRYSFTGYARLEPGFTPEVCRRIASLGVRKLCFGLESASQPTLDHMAKGTEATVAPAVLRACQEAGIRFHVFSMIGLPEEEEDSARQTLAFLLDHREIIDHPGNSFDVHRFGLDVRARYFADRDRLGLEVVPGVFEQELVVSLSHQDWQNTRGLSRQRIGELLEEFGRKVRRAYIAHHNSPRQVWPPFEEHAVLYGEHYAARPFPFMTALPRDAAGTRFSLRLSPACVRQDDTEGATLTSYWGAQELPRRLAQVFTDARPRTVDELVALCVTAPPEESERAEQLVRGLVAGLIGQGILQLAWADGPSEDAAGSLRGTIGASE